MAKRAGVVRTGTIRCAIYTRKSTEEGLEQAFNSLDAQREACAAYIASQRHEGWTAVDTAYDDGGFSGGTMERPGLKRLLADVAAHQVDVIVVYKVDRLTRALSDFAKIVEVLDARRASFVSVTQAFNTTTSMGRLTLNVLLSFAQFEREVTGERIRDKISASKTKGMWMGGPVPLGYRIEERKLLFDEQGAAIVRHIFQRYVALGSGRALIEELAGDGYRTKLRLQSGKPMRGGVAFGRGMLFALLSNRIYLGEVVHKGVAHPGEHAALIEPSLWDAVQQRIADNRISRIERHNARAPSLLAGVLVDGHGSRMSPSHAVKSGRRYRYYVTPASELSTDGPPACRLPAHDIEAAVVAQLAKLLTGRRAIASLGTGDARTCAAMIEVAAASAAKLETSHGRRSIVARLVSLVRLDDARLSIGVDRSALLLMLGGEPTADASPLMLSCRQSGRVTARTSSWYSPMPMAQRPSPIAVSSICSPKRGPRAKRCSRLRPRRSRTSPTASANAAAGWRAWSGYRGSRPRSSRRSSTAGIRRSLRPASCSCPTCRCAGTSRRRCSGSPEPPTSYSLESGPLRLTAFARRDGLEIDVCRLHGGTRHPQSPGNTARI